MNKIFKSMMAMTIAAFTFTSCEDVPEPYNNPYDSLKGEEPIVVEPTGEGTESSPYNVAGINAYAASIAEGQTDTKTIYVTGIVCSVDKFQEKYGEIDYHIADDAKGLSSQFYVYGGYGLDGAKFTSISELSVGDTVTVAGTITNYQGTLEFQYGSKILSQKKGNGSSTETPDVKTVGSKDTPKTVAEALTAINAMEDGATSEEFWFVKGKVKQIITKTDDIAKYKNIDYIITDGTNELKIFRGKNLDNTDFTSADQLQVDDEVVVYGQLLKYEDTKNSKIVPEVAQGNYLVKRTAGGNGGDNGGGDNGGGDNGGGGDVITSLTNGNFEAWSEGLPTGWKSASSASSATLEQSTDAHGGSYAVVVKGVESSNKRLASQEMTLAAGTYTFSFWCKATTSDASQARPGYVPITDGTAGTYQYGDYATLSTEWQQISYEFTLTAETTICLVVMNPKKSSYSSGKDILIDDATLTKK